VLFFKEGVNIKMWISGQKLKNNFAKTAFVFYQNVPTQKIVTLIFPHKKSFRLSSQKHFVLPQKMVA